MESKGKGEEKAVRFSVRSAARADIFSQWDWYVSQGALQIAEKFDASVEKAFEEAESAVSDAFNSIFSSDDTRTGPYPDQGAGRIRGN